MHTQDKVEVIPIISTPAPYEGAELAAAFARLINVERDIVGALTNEGLDLSMMRRGRGKRAKEIGAAIKVALLRITTIFDVSQALHLKREVKILLGDDL